MHEPYVDELPAKATEAVPVLDRREVPRHSCDLPTTVGPDPNVRGAATVKDISAKGVGLVLDQPARVGTVLVIKLQGGNRRLSGPMPLRVLHAHQQSDGRWLHGCVFVRPIRQDDLEELLFGDREKDD